MKKFKTVSQSKIFQDQRELIINEEVVMTNGKKNSFLVSYFKPFVVVIPYKGNQVLMLTQYRHGGKKSFLGFPGGFVNDSEDPVAAALRELKEETGLIALNIELIAILRENTARSRLPFYVLSAKVEEEPDTSRNPDLQEAEATTTWVKISDLSSPELINKMHSAVTLASVLCFLGNNKE